MTESLDHRFSGELVRSPAKGGWTYVVTDWSAAFFGTRGRVRVRGTVDGTPFEVQLISTGAVLDVAADASVLTAVKEQKPNIAYSCQQGFCGTCKVRVLSGEPEHLETRLTPEEQRDHMLICVSRARSARLVLDL